MVLCLLVFINSSFLVDTIYLLAVRKRQSIRRYDDGFSRNTSE